MANPLISFVGDDFTGSTDAMESLALEGVRTVLFTRPPTREMLQKHDNPPAFGVASRTRSMKPDEMEATVRPIFAALRECGAPIVHYKVCSTFDSSPKVGNIGRVIETGLQVLSDGIVPLLVGAPSLGRYCVFGNLFARLGGEGDVFRLDRHPSMSRHPVTPMNEADLRLHLAQQTDLPIGLFDVRHYHGNAEAAFDRVVELGAKIVLIDLAEESQLATAGALLDRRSKIDVPMLVVGSSGVEQALAAYWKSKNIIAPSKPVLAAGKAGPVLILCGSCSPVTFGQVRWAVENGFTEVVMDVHRITHAVDTAARDAAVAALKAGKNVVVHTSPGNRMLKHDGADEAIGKAMGALAREILENQRVPRVAVAGGDTSGRIAEALGIESMEMIATLTRGSPLCRATAPGSPADGCEVTFKGGQIGKVDFFGVIASGHA